MLTETQVQEFKVRLEKERVILEQELKGLGKPNPGNPSDWEPKADAGEFGADRNDNADIIEAMHENNAAINELETRLKNVNEALERIDAGSYGICVVSSEDIEIDRLKANPAAKTCMVHMNEGS